MRGMLLLLTIASLLCAQALDPSALLKSASEEWPTYNGDYSGRRYSSLSQVNRDNVGSLTLAWAFQTRSSVIKGTPLEVNGILYLTTPDNVWALNASTGRQIWHFQRPSEGNHIGQRGVAMYRDRLYFGTPDAHLLCLNARNGKQIWDVEIADAKFGYYLSMAPLIVKDQVIIGTSGDEDDVPHFIEALDPQTGKQLWRWNSLPAPGSPGSETWPNAAALSRGGGPAWMTGTYDPALNLLYWGTGNPHPVLGGVARPGQNLYTCSIVALNADTGKLVWHFQASPHDTHDWDAVETPVLFDADFHGKPRKLLAQASRNGYFFLLDRATGEDLLSTPFVPIDWSKGVNAKGEPIPNPQKEPQPDGALVKSYYNGGTNWMAPSFDPQTGLFYVNTFRGYSLFYLTLDEQNLVEGHQAGTTASLWSQSALVAIDYQTGKIRWSREEDSGVSYPGILTTAGHLLFTADVNGNLLALDPESGKVRWHAYGGGLMNSSPMTYQWAGRQFVLTAVDTVLYAWALPAAE
jgi:alcohol dehydrogenase (cytochrome c)